MSDQPYRAEGLSRIYFVRFGLVLFLIYILIGILRAVFDLGGMAGLSLIAPYLAANFVSELFLKKQHRAPSAEEAKSLAAGCLLTTVGVNIVLFVIAVGASSLNGEPLLGADFDLAVFAVIITVLFALTLLLNYALMRWVFGGQARKRADKLGFGRPQDEF